MKFSKLNFLLILVIVVFSLPSRADTTISSSNKIIKLEIVPVGAVKPMWFENKGAGFGAFGLLGAIAGAIAVANSSTTPEIADAHDKRLSSMFEVSKPQLYFSNELSKLLNKCRFSSNSSSTVLNPTLLATNFLDASNSFSKGQINHGADLQFIVEVGGLTFPYKSAINFDEIEAEAEVRFYKLPNYELVKKYSAKTIPPNGEFIRDGKESGPDNLGEFKSASELVLADVAKNIAKKVCMDKKNGMYN